MLTLFAAISGESLTYAVVWVVVAAVIFYLLKWLIDYIKPDPPFDKVARVILAVAVVVVLINALLTIVGKPFITFR